MNEKPNIVNLLYERLQRFIKYNPLEWDEIINNDIIIEYKDSVSFSINKEIPSAVKGQDWGLLTLVKFNYSENDKTVYVKINRYYGTGNIEWNEECDYDVKTKLLNKRLVIFIETVSTLPPQSIELYWKITKRFMKILKTEIITHGSGKQCIIIKDTEHV